MGRYSVSTLSDMKSKHGLPENRFLTYLQLLPALAILVGFGIIFWGGPWWIGWSLVVIAVAVNIGRRNYLRKKSHS